MLALNPTPKLEDNSLLTSAADYSKYSQLPFIARGRLLHPQPAVVTRNPPNMDSFHVNFVVFLFIS
jgi:hypothetical protein